MQCPYEKDCAFASLWTRVNEAVFNIFDETTIKDLVPDDPIARS
jgi:DNA-binding IscR family transcriptional regulator